MHRSTLAAAAFALAAGQPAPADRLVHVDDRPAPNRARLAVAVEPLAPGPRGDEAAALALTALREGFAAEPALPAAKALLRGFAAANQTLLAENRSAAGGRWDGRVFAGATAIALAGREAIIAQVPPSQAIVVQDKRRYAFPSLASWRPDYLPPDDGPEPDPLGYRDACRPLLYRTLAVPGDLFLLCSSGIARGLALTDPDAIAVDHDVEATLDRLGALVATRELDDAFAAAIRLEAVPRRRTRPLSPPATAHRLPAGPSWPRPAPAPGAVARAVVPAVEPRPGRWGEGREERQPPAAPGLNAAVLALSPATFDPFAALRLGLVGLVEWLAPRPRRVPARPRRVPGVASIRRYRGGPSLPISVRASLPRGLVPTWLGRSAASVLATALLVGGTTLAFEVQRARADGARSALAALEIAVADLAADPLAVGGLPRAEAALAAAGAAGVPPAALAAPLQALETARDTAWGIERLIAPVRLGRLPEALAGREVRLLAVGDRALLAGYGLYEIDPETGRLVELLVPGDTVGGVAVGPIVDAVVDAAGVAVSDGRAVYLRAADGWSRTPFAGSGPPSGRTAGFGGYLYALAGDGSIVKYVDDGDAFAPWPWAGPGDHPDLADARDIAVDGRVHVLLDDGRVLRFYQGVLEAANVVPVMPTLGGDAFFGAAPGSRALYLVDPAARIGPVAGRIIRFDAGGATQQFAAPVPRGEAAAAAAAALAGAREVAVLEGSGRVLFLSGDDLWLAGLPPLIGR